MSERSPFAPGRAIRGGVPVCFPQFADRGPLPQHGFARNLAWRFVDADLEEQGTRARFVLEAGEASLAQWPGRFRLELTATVGGSRLALELAVANEGDAPFDFTAALHTYFLVDDATTATLGGLQGVRYENRGEAGTQTEPRAAFTAAEPIDRVYFGSPASLDLGDRGRAFRISQRGFTDTVVWNPGRERSARMADMPPVGWQRMWCVEAAAIEPTLSLAPGASWSGRQTIEVT